MIIFIYGQNTFSSQRKLKDLKDKFIKDVKQGEDSIKTIDGESMTVEQLVQALGSSSLFSPKRLIVVQNISKNKDKTIFKRLRDYLRDLDKKRGEEETKDDNILFFMDEHSGEKLGRNVLWQYLLKQKFVQKYPLLSLGQLSQWIVQRAAYYGGTLTPSQISKISGTFSSNLWQIDSELKKIIYYKRGISENLDKDTKVVIEDGDLDNMSRGKVDENIFALTDAIGNKNKKLAISLLENEIEAGAADVYLLHMIVRQFKIMLQVKQGLDSGLTPREMASALRLHPYVVQKSLQQVNSFSLLFLKNIFLKLTELDGEMKTGRSEFKVSLGILIARL